MATFKRDFDIHERLLFFWVFYPNYSKNFVCKDISIKNNGYCFADFFQIQYIYYLES